MENPERTMAIKIYIDVRQNISIFKKRYIFIGREDTYVCLQTKGCLFPDFFYFSPDNICISVSI